MRERCVHGASQISSHPATISLRALRNTPLRRSAISRKTIDRNDKTPPEKKKSVMAGRRAIYPERFAGAASQEARQRSRSRSRADADAPHYEGWAKLKGKVAIITGAIPGIVALPLQLVRAKARISPLLISTSMKTRKETKRAVEKEGRSPHPHCRRCGRSILAQAAVDRTVKELWQARHPRQQRAAFQEHVHRFRGPYR